MNTHRRAPSATCVRLSRSPLSLDGHGDEPDAFPGVQPVMQQTQLASARGELQEPEGGAEVGEAAVVGRRHPAEGTKTA
jgi:hypothetical protein